LLAKEEVTHQLKASVMADAVPDTQHEFWRPPVVAPQALLASPEPAAPEVCIGCGTEFMVGAHFCHACGRNRNDSAANKGWMRYLDPQVLKQGVLVIQKELDLPLPSLIAFFLGLGCVLVALLMGAFYSVGDFTDFQALQLSRMQWLLASVAAFVAGILLKRPASSQKK
jgi:hypothetical protein